jgi:hemerythrin-like domain-containing protein
VGGDKAALSEIVSLMKQLAEFYPRHIEKEDKVFFKPAMKYFTKKELDAMLQEEYDFDREFIHIIYGDIVKRAEANY